MSKKIEYIILIVLILVTAFSIFQLRRKVAELETIIKATSASSIATIQANADNALSTANLASSSANAAGVKATTALANANTALTTANGISSTASNALSVANTANSSQMNFANGFSVVRVIPTFAVGPSLSSVSCIDPEGGYLRFAPAPSGKMSFQIMITAQSGNEGDANIYFDITTPYQCNLLNDWNFYASSTLNDTDLDEVLQSKISQLSPTTLRCRYVGNGHTVNYARLTFNGSWSS